MTCVAKHLDHLRSDFSTTCPEAWSDCGDKIVRTRPELVLHPADCCDRRTLYRAAPAGMGRADDLLPPIADQNWRAIGDAHADRDRRIIGHGGVGFGPWSGRVVAAFRDRDVCSMHLAKQQNAIELNPHRPCHCVPFVARVAELEVCGREEVIGNVGEGTAPQYVAPLRLRPLETTARLGLNHDYPRIGH